MYYKSMTRGRKTKPRKDKMTKGRKDKWSEKERIGQKVVTG